MSIRVAIVNHTWDRRAPTPDETLDRFSTLTGWSSAVRDAGAASVVVLQRFHRDAEVMRNGVTYVFCADAHPPRPSWWVRAFPSLDRATAGARADIVHVNGFECPRHLRRLRRLLDPTCALVAQDHGGIEPDSISAVARAWFAWGLSASDAMLISSAGQIDAFRRARLLPASVPAFDVMESSTRMTPVPPDRYWGQF